MEELLRREVGGRTAVAVVTERVDGDIHPERVDADVLRKRQVRLTGSPWVMIDEVHGIEVFDLDRMPGRSQPMAGRGDVLVADRSSDVMAVWVADCAPIVLFGANGSTRVLVHAGWRGLAGGVIDVAVDALEATGTTVGAAVLGPCIHPCCYEFGAADLEQVAFAVGARPQEVAGTTAWATPALDVPAAVESALARRGTALDVVGVCTGCDRRFCSHRRRADPERHALVAWFEACP
jgi:copper oxidase (laccase) domain-containing protein